MPVGQKAENPISFYSLAGVLHFCGHRKKI